jgi:enoyl-CoA hydratase/carnithine racemase
MEWVATGRVFDAAEALAGRLVSRVVPAAELMPAARALADEIAANTSAVSVTLSRRMLWSMLGQPTPWDAHRLDSRAISVLGRGPDVAEGVESFLEKRPPRFSAPVTDYLDVVPEWPAPPADLR